MTCTRVKNISATVRMHAHTAVSHIFVGVPGSQLQLKCKELVCNNNNVCITNGETSCLIFDDHESSLTPSVDVLHVTVMQSH